MHSGTVSRWIVLGVLVSMLIGCGRMLPMGGRSELIKYTVKKGETLYSISWRHGYDHREVAAWNRIKPPYNIYPGQKLLLIAPHKKSAKAKRPVSTAATGSTNTKPKTVTASTSRATSSTSSTSSNTRTTSATNRVEKSQRSHQQKSIAWRWPTKGVIVAGFRPSKGKKGLDIRGKLGQSVLAAASGNVVYSGSGLIGYGNLIIIKHNDTYLSAYGHNRRLLVKEGQKVKQGQKIAEMGDSGKEGVILHFEVRRDGKPVNPLSYLPKRRN